jgi:hypothetical protein
LSVTRPCRFATRGAQLTIRGALGVIELAEGVLAAVTERVVGGSHNGDAADTFPDARTASGPDAPLGQETRPGTERPPAPERPTAEPKLYAGEPTSAPEPPSVTRRHVTETRDGDPAPPVPGEAVHVSTEPELVEEFAEPGAEEGAGAQLRIVEPWAGYADMKAADIIERMAFATREELAAIELYELAGRNRKSVAAAARRALERASPPR